MLIYIEDEMQLLIIDAYCAAENYLYIWQIY